MAPNSNLVPVLTGNVYPKGKHRAPNGHAATAYIVKLRVLTRLI